MDVIVGVVGWIILGGVAGWLASILTGRRKQSGCLTNIGVGIVGALIGGFIFNFFGGQGLSGLNLTSLLVAIVGAVVLLAVVNLFTRDR